MSYDTSVFGIESVIELIAPHVCMSCGLEGKIICTWCQPDAFPALPSRCYRCKRLTHDFSVCKSCRSGSKLRRVWCATGYEKVAKDLLWCYKFDRARAAANPIAQALDAILPFLTQETIISFVPTATSRLRLRGYDQAELIAKELARLRNLSCARLVTRISQARQVGSTKQQRERQMHGAFVVTKPGLCQNATILIVDDIITTGSTLEAVARMLRTAGAAHVDGAIFAQQA